MTSTSTESKALSAGSDGERKGELLPTVGASVNLKSTSEPVSAYGVILRRGIAPDNSCLFNAVGYLMEAGENAMQGALFACPPFLTSLDSNTETLRHLCVKAIAEDPKRFDEVFLGDSVASYSAMLLDPMKWGGAIELVILAAHYKVEVRREIALAAVTLYSLPVQIAAVDMSNVKTHVFGADAGAKHRIYLLYSGIHYDAIVAAKSADDATSAEKKLFEAGGGDGTEERVLAFALEEQKQRLAAAKGKPRTQLRCGECGAKLKDTDAAQAHYGETSLRSCA